MKRSVRIARPDVSDHPFKEPEALSDALHLRRLLTQFALWMHPTWDAHNADDVAAAGVAVAVFLEERDDVNPRAEVGRG